MHCISLIFISCFLNIALGESVDEDNVRPENFEERLSRLEELVDIQSQTITDLREDNTNLRETCLNSSLVMESHHISKRYSNEQVAFYAYLSQGKCFSEHETFIFNTELLDSANSYSTHVGVFITPVTGVYAFSFNVVSAWLEHTQAELMVNGHVKARVFADSDTVKDVHTASNTVVLALQINDHVYVRRGSNAFCTVVSLETAQWTYFAGWRVF
ncbi:cerebellin-4-like [Mya arenaria]|uniref:cerebellin-4-like n=1 Tax=Mya arenaria TaxID=6604 RepID=UPI0022E3553C|nr:cerebellin-4-like [Mya arenaria]